MVRRGGRAHLQKQGGMLAALGVDEPIPPQRKENVHSNKPESVKEGVGPIKKELPQQLKTGELHATQQQKVIGTLRSKPDDNEPLLTTPSAPLSSIEINLCEAADKSVSRELFQSPLSTVSSSPDSTSDDSSALSPTSVNKMRRSTDFRSTASDNDGEYSCTSSEEDFTKSGDESRESYSDSESVESGGSEVAPTYEESEDDEYSLEVEESEDELEFDEESDDEKWGKKDRRKNPKKSANKGTTKSIESINKQQVKESKSKAAVKAKSSKTPIHSKSKDSIEPENDKQSIDNTQCSVEEDNMSEKVREDHPDFEEEDESPHVESAQLTQTNEMSSYISTLQHTEIKAVKKSTKRPTKTAITKEPPLPQILSAVDDLFQMIGDINLVTVGDISHSVAKHFGLSKVKKETRKAIKTRLTELVYAKATGFDVAPISNDDKKPKEQNKPRKRAVTKKKEKKMADCDPVQASGDPSDSDIIILVDQLFEAAENDTVYFSEILRSVASHFGLSTVKKETKRLIRARFVKLINSNENNAEQDDDQECEIQEEAQEDNQILEESSLTVENHSSTCTNPPSTSHQEFEEQLADKKHTNNGISKSSHDDSGEGDVSFLNAAQTPQVDKGTKSPLSQDKCVTEEPFKCNESFMSCETTLFKNLSPECAKSDKNEPIDKLMGSLSMSESLSSINRSQRVEKGKWSLGNEIGSGSFGVVHVGMNAVDGSLMAIKVLKIPSQNKTAIVQELQREIDLMRSLNHPNIVRYLGAEVDTQNNILNIFQEWVPGGSVSSLLKKFGPFSLAVVRLYTSQILKGLDYLHSHHIIHRDIKGGNILISNDGSVKLADFGASKRVEAFGTDPDKMMEELTVRGTPYFMAPEVYDEKYGPKADIWSVGGVVYQMATGSPPWKNLGHKNPISLFFHLKNTEDPPQLPSTIGNRYLKEFISQCFKRDPSNRPDVKALLNHKFLSIETGADVSNSPQQIPLKKPCSPERRCSPRPAISFSPNAHDTSMSDSLCYSLTLPAPAHIGDHSNDDPDTSDWPDWAKHSYQQSSSKPTRNPFARNDIAGVHED